MSDKSQAMKKPLGILYPDSRQLLCGFHVGQAEWDWINSNVIKEYRIELMSEFKKVKQIKYKKNALVRLKINHAP